MSENTHETSEPVEAKPELALNRGTHTVAQALSGFITGAATGLAGGTRIDIATAYFNVGGYMLIADSLDAARETRLLLGAEPEPAESRPRRLTVEPSRPLSALRARLSTALADHEHNLKIERDHLGFSSETDAAARRLVAWLRSDSVQVRRLEDRFLHGKAFVASDLSHGVVAGSSNLTRAGLSSNIELNLGNYTPHTVGQVQEWFDELWDHAADYDLAALFEPRFEPHTPQLIYLRMLWERYGDEIQREASDTAAPQIHLTAFQTDGLWRARSFLDTHHGVLIADEVGLGKTFLAGELIREAALDRRQRVLVITPATLRDGPWRAFQARHNLPMELVSFDDVAADGRLNPDRAGGVKLAAASINDYAMVVVDEAHNLRNPATQRAGALRRLLAGSPPKKLVLLTATPVNNSLWDLYHLLGYFLRNDAVFADAGIPSVRDRFSTAMALNPDDLTPEHLFDVLDAVAVRRTRSFVKHYYANDTVNINGVDTTIVFPTPRVHKVSYDLDAVLPGFFDRIAAALDPDANPDDATTLTLARYAPSQYRLDAGTEAYETQLAGLMRSQLLKRFESSPHAFANTCQRMAASHDAFISLLQQGQVATGEALADWVATDSDDMDEVDTYLDTHIAVLGDAANYDTANLLQHATSDAVLLRDWATEARSVTPDTDPTLAALCEELAAIAEQAQREAISDSDERNRRKVLIFSYYADTVDWIHDHLRTVTGTAPRLAVYKDRLACLSGSASDQTKKALVWGFAPATTDAPEGHNDDRYDILVATDVLAEGVNLQQCRHIINYDLPWNPMRLVQRHGRIDRIGSPHHEAHLRCVFPDARLDDLLNLEQRLRRKIAQAAATVGVGTILPDQDSTDVNFTETREEIERLRNSDASLFERGGTVRGALSGEEYRQQLRQALENPELAEQIQQLPWGSGSGMAISNGKGPGYVFCIRVGDWPQPVFRYVTLADPDNPQIISDTLACLDRAHPADGFDTPRALSEDTHRGLFAAWPLAAADVLARWNHLADKANLEPRLPAALMRAADIVRDHAPDRLTQQEIDRAVDTLYAPYPERTVRSFRAAMNTITEPAEQAELILGVIRDLGLEPYTPPEPLPEITEDDIHLVCWLALSAQGEEP